MLKPVSFAAKCSRFIVVIVVVWRMIASDVGSGWGISFVEKVRVKCRKRGRNSLSWWSCLRHDLVVLGLHLALGVVRVSAVVV